MSAHEAYNARRVVTPKRMERKLKVGLDIPGDRDTVVVDLYGAAPPYIDHAALILTWKEACQLHHDLGEFLKNEAAKIAPTLSEN